MDMNLDWEKKLGNWEFIGQTIGKDSRQKKKKVKRYKIENPRRILN
jgi:hypothetical protein